MRKHHHKQLLELIATLNEANSEINRLISQEDTSAVIRLLSDCQTSALHIGEFIERLEGEGTKSVSLLEEYCDLLYQISIEITNRSISGSFFKQIRKLLLKIENSIRTELKPNKIEMVFLPYKASMWDSMESLWLAAKSDPQCDAYVVPIPYFDRLTGGAFGKMNYEGNQYPDYVPIVDWRKFNIEEHHPDIIVAHSPYDDGNYVTSIHPDFYNNRLKDLTDLLVYVPYFICVDDVESYFCVCAGTLYADKVIVQSEKIRNTYIRNFKEFEKANNCKGLFGNADTKFVALGSPKFDKVINSSREDYEIPEEWRKMIERPDGTRKKVILYNTSVTGLLTGNKKVLSKLRYVFDTFKGQSDVILLWRPHPLNEAAYQAMRPQLLIEYNSIVAQYKQLGFGIYDDTPDLHRAIALSDAYYGDGSSLVALFQCAGKPVMIQDLSVIGENDYLSIANLYDHNDSFWFTIVDINALFRMDKQTWETEYIGEFPNEDHSNWQLHGPIIDYGGNLYFAPGRAKEIAEYDLENNTIKQIPVLKPRVGTNSLDSKIYKFCGSVKYKEYLFFVGCYYPAILRVDMTTGKSDYFTDWLEPLKKLSSDLGGRYFDNICVVGSHIAAVAMSANAVAIFDMDTCTSKVYEVGSKGCCYSGICYDGSNYWLSPKFNGPIVKWNPNTAFKEFDNFPDGFSVNEGSFSNICCSGGYIWMFPNEANMALKINLQDESIVVAEEFQEKCECDNTDSCYFFSMVSNDIIYAFMGKTKRLISFDCKSKQRREGNLLPSVKDIKTLAYKKRFAFIKDASECTSVNDLIYYERSWLTTKDFISYIAGFAEFVHSEKQSNEQIEIYRKTVQHADGTSGEAIYTYCKREVMS